MEKEYNSHQGEPVYHRRSRKKQHIYNYLMILPWQPKIDFQRACAKVIGMACYDSMK